MADKEVFFDEVEQLVAAAERLSTEGWDVHPAPRPEQGVSGFQAERSGACAGSLSESVFLGCALYGLPLEPEVTVCSSAAEFVKALEDRGGHEMEKSDSLEEGQVGFVTYGKASEGKSEVFRIDVAALKAGGANARASLMAILLRSQKTVALEKEGPSPASGGR